MRKVLLMFCVCVSKVEKNKYHEKRKKASKEKAGLGSVVVLFCTMFALSCCCLYIQDLCCKEAAPPPQDRALSPDELKKKKEYDAKPYIDNNGKVIPFQELDHGQGNATVFWDRICKAEKREDLKELFIDSDPKTAETRQLIAVEFDMAADNALCMLKAKEQADMIKEIEALMKYSPVAEYYQNKTDCEIIRHHNRMSSVREVFESGVWKKWPIIKKMFPQYDTDESIIEAISIFRFDSIEESGDPKVIDGYRLPKIWGFFAYQSKNLLNEKKQFIIQEVKGKARTSSEERELIKKKLKEFWKQKLDDVLATGQWKTWPAMEKFKILKVDDRIIEMTFREDEKNPFYKAHLLQKGFNWKFAIAFLWLIDNNAISEAINKDLKYAFEQRIAHKSSFIEELKKNDATQFELDAKVREFIMKEIDAIVQEGSYKSWASVDPFEGKKRDEVEVKHLLSLSGPWEARMFRRKLDVNGAEYKIQSIINSLKDEFAKRTQEEESFIKAMVAKSETSMLDVLEFRKKQIDDIVESKV